MHRDISARVSTGELGIGVVGVGRFGSAILANLAQIPSCNVRAVCDIDASRLTAAALPGRALDARVAITLARTDVDAVLIATPVDTHARLVLLALTAGKHVFVEKPLALARSDAEQIAAAARKYQRRVMVGQVLVFHPAYEALEEWISEHYVGDILSLSAWRDTRADFDDPCRLWWELAPHDLYLASRLGFEAAPALGCRAQPGRVSVRFLDANGRHLECRVGSAGGGERGCIVEGTQGRIQLLESESRLLLSRTGAADQLIVSEHVQRPLLRELTHFCQALLEDAPFRVSLGYAATSVALLEAGATAIGQQRVQALEKPSASLGPPNG